MKKDIEYLICRENETIEKVMRIISTNKKKIAFVLSENTNKIIGTVSDGDIRSKLLDGKSLKDSISDCMCKNFYFLKEGDNDKKHIEVPEGISIVPIVDEEMELIGYEETIHNQYIPISSPQFGENELKYLTDAFLSSWISSTGEYINRFEKEFAAYCGSNYGVATSNGTTALHLALLALGIGPGDEVIVPDITFAATINSVIHVGATPIIVDIDEESWCISPKEIVKAITPNTKAIIPVHIYGQPCDMVQIMQIARDYNLYVIEDCAEAHGASVNGQKVGSIGDIGCFSFFGNKVITTGEGGMCLTNNSQIEQKLRLFKDHGMSKEKKYYHEVVGYNYRMTNLQAAIGLAQIERIDEILAWRKDLEDAYYQKMEGIPGITLQKRDIEGREKIVWLVSILVPAEKRDKIENKLKELDIDVRNFFIPLSHMEIYKKYVFSNFVSSQIANQGINLPTTYDISEDIIERIIKGLNDGLE